MPAVAALFLTALGSCDSDPVVEPEPALEIVPDSVTLTHIGQQFAFSVRGGGPGAGQVRWISQDTTVFVVDGNGSVTARGNGGSYVQVANRQSFDQAVVHVRQAAAVLEPFGEGQRAAPGLSLLGPVGARVLDAGGAPVSGVAVRFEAGMDGGSVEPGEVQSDREGLAAVVWTLGPEPGRQTLAVSVEGAAGVEIAATALDPDEAVASFEVRSGDDQWAWSGRALAEPVVVQALDEGGRPLRGATVRFEPDAGGRADPGTAVSDSAGVASTAWTLGTAPGSQTLTISTGGDAAVEITATARDPNGAVASLEAHSGDEQWALAGHALPDSVSVRVMDDEGRPIWGAKMRFEPDAGSGRADPGEDTTDSLGVASAVWRLGSELGEHQLRATAANDATVTLHATAVSNEGVCYRTPAVSAEIARAARVGSCAEVTEEMLGGVTGLDLASKGITRLRSEDFAGLIALRSLLLMVNQLEELPPDLFRGLHELSTLWLGVNPLGELPPGIFAGLTNLTSLALNTNGLTMLPPGVFDDLVSLELLILENNFIESLPPDVFVGLPNLRVLNLNRTRLSELPPGILDSTTRLERLYAESNRLSHLPERVFGELSNLTRLYLTRNQIRELSPRAFDGLVNLEEIRLSTNYLYSLPPGIFAELKSLRYARLRDNPGAPFPVHAELGRADTSDLLAAGPADVVLRVPTGAPFPFRIPVSVQRGTASREFLAVEVGDTVSRTVEVAAAGKEAVHVSLGAPPGPPEGFAALRIVPGGSIALFAEEDNRTPVIRSVIPAHRLQAGGPAAELALAEYFGDPDGDSLVYEVEPEDPAVVGARIENGTLWLEPGAEDTTEVAVTASDGGGLRAVQQFLTWVAPAPDPDAFNIELIFGPGFTDEAKTEIRQAADRWMEVVVGDLSDVPVDGQAGDWCLYPAPSPRLVGVVDDLVIFMHMSPGERDAIGLATKCSQREESGLAIVAANWFSDVYHSDSYTYTFYETALHEIGHVLGIGSWLGTDLFREDDGDPHFVGPLAVAAFDAAGGEGYAGRKVPVEDRAVPGGGGKLIHWRSRVMPEDVMTVGTGGNLLTAITVQALADLGHVVDVSKADPYTLPGQAQGDVLGVATDAETAVAELSADDVIEGPVVVVDKDGKVVRVIRP